VNAKTAKSTTPTSLRSEAWLLRGISAIPGELRLSGNRISFTVQGRGSAWDWQLRKLERHARTVNLASLVKSGRDAVLFDANLRDVAVAFPWYYFSGGLVVKTSDDVYKLSFGRPANSPRAGVSNGPARAVAELKEIGSMRIAGKAWRETLRRNNPHLTKDA
jgi:hypothetical protein